MLKVMIGFFRGLFTLAWPWWIWVGLLIVANLVAPLFFFGTLEARLVIAAFLLAAMIQMAIFRAKGFVRLLGLGHILGWVPLLIWLVPRLGEIGTDTAFGQWLMALVVLDVLSLVIDVADVARYLGGERTPTVTLESLSGG